MLIQVIARLVEGGRGFEFPVRVPLIDCYMVAFRCEVQIHAEVQPDLVGGFFHFLHLVNGGKGKLLHKVFFHGVMVFYGVIRKYI